MEINEYEKLIEDINLIIQKIESQQGVLRRSIDKLNNKIGDMDRRVAINGRKKQEIEEIIDILENFKSKIYQIGFKKALPSAIIIALISYIILALLTNPVITITVSSILGIIIATAKTMRCSKEIRKIKSEHMLEDELNNLNMLNYGISMNLACKESIKQEIRNSEKKIGCFESDKKRFEWYKRELGYGKALATELSLGKESEIDRIFFYDPKAQEIKKLVRENVEN